MKKVYYATVGGFINGVHRAKGECCGQMTERQAKYYILSGLIVEGKPKGNRTEKSPKNEPSPATLERKTR